MTVKTRPQVGGDRRLRGRLLAADEDGFELAVEGAETPMRLVYSDVDRVRTVFEWGPSPRPGAGGKKRKQDASR